MSKGLPAAFLVAFTLCCGVCLAQGYSSVSFARSPRGIPPKKASMMPAGQPNSMNNCILYNGGPVLNQPNGTNVYLIWYGKLVPGHLKADPHRFHSVPRLLTRLQHQHHLL